MNKILPIFFLIFAHLACAQEKVDTFSYTEHLNVSYLEPDEVKVDSLQKLNLVLPKGVEKPPLLIWIGGGAWSYVNRHVEMNLARKFAREGIAVASIGHRLSRGLFSSQPHPTGVKHPEHVKDLAAAFKWLYDHAETYGYNPNNLFVGGFSSGAHLSALLATDKRYLAAHGLSLKHIKAILPIAGAYDINHYYHHFAEHEQENVREMADTHVKDVFGDSEEDFIDASPSNYLENLSIPMLLVSDNGLFFYTKVFEEQLRNTEYRNCQIVHVFDFNHSELWKDISNAPNSQTRNIMLDFIRRHSGSNS